MTKKAVQIELSHERVSLESLLVELIKDFERLVKTYGTTVRIKEIYNNYKGQQEYVLYCNREEFETYENARRLKYPDPITDATGWPRKPRKPPKGRLYPEGY